jgi:hypothetical protein
MKIGIIIALVVVASALAQDQRPAPSGAKEGPTVAPAVPGGSAGVKLREIIIGQRVAMMVAVAAELGIPDLLKDGPKSAEVLAASTKTHAPSLYRLLRALASYEVFAEESDGKFRLTPIAELLRSDVPGSQRESARRMSKELSWRSSGHLIDAVRTGKTAIEIAFGMDLWAYLAKHPEEQRAFNETMAAGTRQQAAEIAKLYDFSTTAKVVDIAGGHGILLAAILEAHPKPRAVLFELPAVIEETRTRLAPAIRGRLDLTSGDFFKAVPEGGDVYMLKNIVHDWDDERAIAILKNCRRAMSRSSRLLVIEGVVPTGNSPSPTKIMDMNMLVHTGGRERTEAEHRALLGKSGFRVERIIPVSAATSIIEASPQL